MIKQNESLQIQKKASYELSIELYTDKPLDEIHRILSRYVIGIADYTNVYSDGTPDVDGHNGGVWKMADSLDGFRRKSTRLGTYDGYLNRIGD